MIKIIYQGRLCNNLIQWLFGKILSLQLNTGYISNEQLTKWFPNTKNNIINENLSNIIELRGHKIDIENILPNQHIILNGFYQRYEIRKTKWISLWRRKQSTQRIIPRTTRGEYGCFMVELLGAL